MFTVRSWKRVLAKGVLFLGGCLVGLLVVELGLRLIGYRLGTNSAYQPDDYCGVRHVPGFRGWHTSEGRVWIEINRHGFRDRERTIEKPRDMLRIAVIGDSFAEALQVELEETFWSVMERRLAERCERPIEVLNFGVAGYGTAQEFELLRHEVWDYQPDLVLLQFFAANDVASNSRQLEPQSSGRPFYTIENDRLVLDDSFLRDAERIRFQTSYWLKLKDFVVHTSRVGALLYQFRHQKHEPRNRDGDEYEIGLAMQAFCESADAEWQKAWTVTDRLVAQMARDAESHGAKFAVLTANSGIELEIDDAIFERALRQLGIPDFLYPERRLKALGAQEQFAVIGLADSMRDYAKRHQVYLHGFANTQMGTGHWNKVGHRVAGELVAARLLDLGLLDLGRTPSGVARVAPRESDG